MGLSLVWRIMQIEEIFRPRWITASEICMILHIIRKPYSVIVLFFIQYISKFFKTPLPPSRLLSKTFACFSSLQLVVIKRIFSVADIPQKRWFNLSSNIFCVFLLLAFVPFSFSFVHFVKFTHAKLKQLGRKTAACKQGCAFILGNMPSNRWYLAYIFSI